MAAAYCKKCGSVIDSHVLKCPVCSAHTPKKSPAFWFFSVFFCITGLIFIAFFVGYIRNDLPSTVNVPQKSWKEHDNSVMAYMMMKDAVKRRLKSPGSAEFPGIFSRGAGGLYHHAAS